VHGHEVVKQSGWSSISFSIAIGIMAASAHASLGSSRGTVEADRVHLSATVTSEIAGDNRVETLLPKNGGVVREYSDANGVVFAITWRGPARPDLRQLLGERFTGVAGQMSRHAVRRTSRLLVMSRPEVVVRSQGRPGAFSGIAFDPRLVPAGFSADDLR
jgi:hypothetical protein